ncbi:MULTISPECIES: hypothetical protein [unclassified Mucilaginibacter]|uniref:bestrophin-like domain n=1 Tax=unclassified Mucilaginibacter TaxID=2617802 RepID=UPI002AC8F783|nr:MULTISPECIES: hypothetical protein [unclassified Mucilaginibacter]MEB0260693.1 hypothetical protein [Mucilaginibacter sp. 10I4]MEB0280635.1 hypothetical protein [Mucilaginibacter sp. 10B2]MEB0300953.1 hypothetical protein [Mucilaginibacter sp. 5C4]WPX24948.1 hypothetical protein RHM67_06675 [Mucilaginibacter sp. 5C4]
MNILYNIPSWLIALIMIALMIATNAIGYYFKQQNHQKDPIAARAGLGPVEGSLLGLLALLLSFTFSISACKNDQRRKLITEEANDIGTVILRTDLYPDSARLILRDLLSTYIDERMAYYTANDDNKIIISLKTSNTTSALLWGIVSELAQDPSNTLRSQQMIPALNAMIDIVSTRDAERKAHVPESIIWLLFTLTLAGSFIIGYGTKGKFNWIMVWSFSLMTAITIYLILDLDRPRRGIINMDEAHSSIIELKRLLK